MTVRELIAKLQALPEEQKDLDVWMFDTGGGTVDGVVVRDFSGPEYVSSFWHPYPAGQAVVLE